MNQNERRIWLIKFLLREENQDDKNFPTDENSLKKILRGLMNVRPPKNISNEFLKIQDEYLQTEIKSKGVTKISDLKPIREKIYLWQGDITLLECDAIVNAANSGMTGCYFPNHKCIDNAIHTFAGVQLRNFCEEIIKLQGHAEPTGQAKITPAFNLPCKNILHTVGPIVGERLTAQDEKLLASCYKSCLNLAIENDLKNIAFCCISTGEFHFPNKRAAEIAIETVTDFQKSNNIEVIFNVFKDVDREIYRELLER